MSWRTRPGQGPSLKTRLFQYYPTKPGWGPSLKERGTSWRTRPSRAPSLKTWPFHYYPGPNTNDINNIIETHRDSLTSIEIRWNTTNLKRNTWKSNGLHFITLKVIGMQWYLLKSSGMHWKSLECIEIPWSLLISPGISVNSMKLVETHRNLLASTKSHLHTMNQTTLWTSTGINRITLKFIGVQ